MTAAVPVAPVIKVGMDMEGVRRALGEPVSEAGGPAGYAAWRYDGAVLQFRDGQLDSWYSDDPSGKARIKVVRKAAPAPSREPVAEGLPTGRDLFFHMFVEGIIQKYSVESGEVWVAPALWAMMNRDQKEILLEMLAMAREQAGEAKRIEVLSYQNDELLGKVGILGPKILQ